MRTECSLWHCRSDHVTTPHHIYVCVLMYLYTYTKATFRNISLVSAMALSYLTDRTQFCRIKLLLLFGSCELKCFSRFSYWSILMSIYIMHLCTNIDSLSITQLSSADDLHLQMFASFDSILV